MTPTRMQPPGPEQPRRVSRSTMRSSQCSAISSTRSTSTISTRRRGIESGVARRAMDTSEKQIKRIVLDRMERCGTCHHVFGPEEIHVISRRPDMWMMVVECVECHARNFVAAVLNDGDASEAQVALRRLSRED